jgi:hypothetical protein
MSNDIAPQGLGQEWLDKLAHAAKEQAATEKPTGNFFSTKGGILSWNQMALPGNKMEVIALASMHENVYYGGAKFDAANPASPLCYAFSLSGQGMAPHDESEQKQAPTCTSCPHSKWGTGDGGKGTACRPTRRITLLPASAAASVDAVEKATAGLLRVPITSVANWTAYVNSLANKQIPTLAIICEVALMPDARTMFKIHFTAKRPIADTQVLGALMLRKPLEEVAMQSPYAKRNINQAQQQPAPAAFAGALPAAIPTVAATFGNTGQTTAIPPAAFGAVPPPAKF